MTTKTTDKATRPQPSRLNPWVLVLGLLIIVPMILLFAKSFAFDPEFIESPLLGKPAPDFTLVDLDGNTVSLSSLRGTPVVLNFWASYCQPCVTEHPTFTAAARHYQDRVQFLGIIYQDQDDRIQAFNQQFGTWGPTLKDPAGKVAIAYGIYGPPETFFIDREGTVQLKVISAVHPQLMKETLDAML